MRKIIVLSGVILAAVLAACADSSEKKASRDYVKAAQKVAKAAKSYDSANYSEAYNLCLSAQSDVERLVDNYPESAIVLKVVTDSSTLIGPCRYVDMVEKIIPRLKLYGDPDMKSVELAWVIAASQPAGVKRDEAVFALASNLCSVKISDEERQKLFSALLLRIKSPELRSELKARCEESKNAPSATSDRAVAASVAVPAAAESSKIDDISAFMKQARTDAALVAYELRAIDNLKNKASALRASSSDAATLSEFEKILSTAYDNIQKISTADVKEKALVNIAIAFANLGCDLRAIAISEQIRNQDTFLEVFRVIADSASRGKNYKEAFSLSTRISDSVEKNKYLRALSVGVASQGLFEQAQKIVAAISDPLVRNDANARCARLAFDAKNPQAAAVFVAALDIKNLDCLAAFDKTQNFADELNPTVVTGIRLANLAAEMVSVNPSIAETINSLAIKEASKSSASPKDFAILCKRVAMNFVALSKPEAALDFISRNIHNGDSSSALQVAYYVVESSKDGELARKAFSLAANICESLSISDKIGLAIALQNFDLPRADAAEILSAFLPKFQ